MSGQYEALAAKAKAMYGRRLRWEDLQRISQRTTLGQVIEDLGQQPGWSGAAAALNGLETVTRDRLEDALRQQLQQEHLRLSAFVPRGDRALMEFPILQAELSRILAALRRLQASLFKEVEPLPPRYALRSRVDFERLRSCRDYEGLLSAVEGSIYHRDLVRLRPPEGAPEYGVTEARLRAVYYRHMLHLISSRYAGEIRRVLERSMGGQADMLNIMHILRMKEYFPQEENYLPVLLPYRYRLKQEQIRAMCAAPSGEAVLELLDNTPYGGVFRGVRTEELSNRYAAVLYRASRRQLMMGRPSIHSAVAYLNLRELELKAVMAAVEASKYGIPLDPSFLEIMDG